MKYTVLVVEDEYEQRRAVIERVNWEAAGFEVVGEAENGVEALDIIETLEPDLILTDIKMPMISGLELAKRVRELRPATQMVILSGYDSFEYARTAIEYNIISYLLKPISPAELTARIDALYRRIGGDSSASSELLTQGPFVMNTRNHTLEKNGNRIRLTQVEYAILKLFMQNPGRALSREDILSAVWGRDYEGELKIVDVNIRRLRLKIEDDTSNPTYITTVWGLGYKWGA